MDNEFWVLRDSSEDHWDTLVETHYHNLDNGQLWRVTTWHEDKLIATNVVFVPNE